jgi:hypothetical protein
MEAQQIEAEDIFTGLSVNKIVAFVESNIYLDGTWEKLTLIPISTVLLSVKNAQLVFVEPTINTVREFCVYDIDGIITNASLLNDNADILLIVDNVIVPSIGLFVLSLPPPLWHLFRQLNGVMLYDDVSAASNHTTQFDKHCGEKAH